MSNFAGAILGWFCPALFPLEKHDSCQCFFDAALLPRLHCILPHQAGIQATADSEP